MSSTMTAFQHTACPFSNNLACHTPQHISNSLTQKKHHRMNDFSLHYKRLIPLSFCTLIGLILALLSAVISQIYSSSSLCTALAILGGILALPGFIYMYCLTILHWKHRYSGRHSNLWGIILLIETSGLFKIIYFIRHILPDLLRARNSRP